MIKQFYSSINFLLKVTKKYSTSKLYIPYNQTANTYVVVEPYVDLENRLKYLNILKDNITLRGLNINVDKICDNWSNFLCARDELIRLNVEKEKLTDQLKKINKDNVSEVDALRESRSKVMNRLKSLREHISTLEKDIVIPSLCIPNSLHPDCPKSEIKILFQYNGKTELNNKDGTNHLEIGKTLDCLYYVNSTIVYLKNEVSVCERAILTYFNESLDQLDFIPVCNSDLIKSVVVEGCGADVQNADQTFILNDDNLHLVGGASIQSFCAFLTKQSVGENKLPLKLCTSGRSYKPSNNNFNGLFSAVQTNAVELFIGAIDESQARVQFDEMLNIYKRLYEDIGLNYRIVYSPVSALENWECLKAQVQLYSVGSQDYIAVGSLSLSGDFISKRLRIYYSNKDKHNFLHIVSGKIIDTNILLACLLEQNVNKFTIPDCLKNYSL